MTGAEFGKAVKRVYLKHTGRESTHGAWAWFGGWCFRTGRAIYDYTVLERVPKGPHLTILLLLEIAPKGSRNLRALRARIERERARK